MSANQNNNQSNIANQKENKVQQVSGSKIDELKGKLNKVENHLNNLQSYLDNSDKPNPIGDAEKVKAEISKYKALEAKILDLLGSLPPVVKVKSNETVVKLKSGNNIEVKSDKTMVNLKPSGFKEGRDPRLASREQLKDLLITNTQKKLHKGGTVHGIKATYLIQGEMENWELFTDYYQSPKASKKCVDTLYPTLEEVLEKAQKDYDTDQNKIDCEKWGGISAAAFTVQELELNLELTISNYKIQGVPLTFGIMSALLFSISLTAASRTLFRKMGKGWFPELTKAFVAAELGIYEAGPLGGMNPDILEFISNMYKYEYKGEYKSEKYKDIYEEWKAVFAKNWQDDVSNENTFACFEFGFNLVAIAKLLERGQFGEGKCPDLMQYTFGGLTNEDIQQLAVLAMIHRRAAQGAGVAALDYEDTEASKPIVEYFDYDWYEANFEGDTLIEISTAHIINNTKDITKLRTQHKLQSDYR